jgi:hypothetical protein
MLSDRIISFFNRFITITRHDIFLIAVAILVCLAFWSALYFSRKRVIFLRRSSGTDQLTFELSRIADALDRLASQSTDRAIAAAARRQQRQSQLAPEPPGRVAYSMFGR